MINKKIIGDYGEDIATKYLQKRNYKIIERNVKISYQEIDIIASIKEKIVFIEVKTRVSQYSSSGEEALNQQKIKNLKKAIIRYCGMKKIDIDDVNFDLIVVNINKINKIAKIKHYLAIF